MILLIQVVREEIIDIVDQDHQAVLEEEVIQVAQVEVVATVIAQNILEVWKIQIKKIVEKKVIKEKVQVKVRKKERKKVII